MAAKAKVLLRSFVQDGMERVFFGGGNVFSTSLKRPADPGKTEKGCEFLTLLPLNDGVMHVATQRPPYF
ncbi:unnamed protein product [Porites lobata]|nr:unnamed protein product [Porites lobata]